MKIHELEEGKIYKHRELEYKVLNYKLLFKGYNEKWRRSDNDYNSVIEMDFEEVAEPVKWFQVFYQRKDSSLYSNRAHMSVHLYMSKEEFLGAHSENDFEWIKLVEVKL